MGIHAPQWPLYPPSKFTAFPKTLTPTIVGVLNPFGVGQCRPMKTSETFQSLAICLNTSGAPVPDWIQLTPQGPEIVGRDGRTWILNDPEAVVKAFNLHGARLPVDFEHATQIKGLRGEKAPAVGFIDQIETRDNALWGHVDWNEEGRNAISAREYGYVSPVFGFEKSTGNVTRMISAGLTNQPNLHLAALNTQNQHLPTQKEPAMNKAILEALGLKDGASDDDVLTAINTLKTSEATALNRAEHPDSTKFVPKADYDLALNQISTFEVAEKNRLDAEIGAVVDASIEAGKIAPASRDYHIAACQNEGGFAAFKAMVEASPEIAGKSRLDGKEPAAANKPKLSVEEIAACRALGLTEEDFAAAKAEE